MRSSKKGFPITPTDVTDWPELLKHPSAGDHFVQVYRDEDFLAEAVAEYTGTGLRRGEGVIIIATPAHSAAFSQQLEESGFATAELVRRGQLILLDAEETLAKFTPGSMP